MSRWIYCKREDGAWIYLNLESADLVQGDDHVTKVFLNNVEQPVILNHGINDVMMGAGIRGAPTIGSAKK